MVDNQRNIAESVTKWEDWNFGKAGITQTAIMEHPLAGDNLEQSTLITTPVIFQTQIKADGGGKRFDDGKPRYDLVPPEAMDALADHYRKGAQKYTDRNWERGMAWGKCFASMMRHAWAWLRGEEIDPETGTHHMIAVAWNAIALYTYHTRKIGNDDRNIVKENSK